jgi:hypothetical protein
MEFNVVFNAKGYSTFKLKMALYAIGAFAFNSFNIKNDNTVKRTHPILAPAYSIPELSLQPSLFRHLRYLQVFAAFLILTTHRTLFPL